MMSRDRNRNLTLICSAGLAIKLNSTRAILLRNELPNGPYPFAAPGGGGGGRGNGYQYGGGGGGDPDGDMNLVKLMLGVAVPAAAVPAAPVSGGAAVGGTPSRKKLFE
eukprot:COSAG06_NODE_745_length_12649_cov_128.650916_11_plen_108_part_00